jgi:Ca2+-binding EF-hand superfamily protein
VGIIEENVHVLFQSFDKNNDGTINYLEFIDTLRGPMNEQRVKVVKDAFA